MKLRIKVPGIENAYLVKEGNIPTEVIREIVESFYPRNSSKEERIERLAGSSIVKEWAGSLCRMAGYPTEECEERAARNFAERVISESGRHLEHHSVPTEEEVAGLIDRTTSLAEEMRTASSTSLVEAGREYSDELNSLLEEINSSLQRLSSQEREVFKDYLKPLTEAYGELSSAKASLDAAIEAGRMSPERYSEFRDALLKASRTIPEARSRMRTIAEVCPSAVGHVTS